MDNNFQKPRRIARMALVGSLALNIALIGAIGGFAYKMQKTDAAPQRFLFDFGGVARVLDHDDRRAIGEKMRRNGPRPVTRGNQSAHMEILAEALRAEPFDQNQFAELMSGLRKRSADIQDNAQSAFIAHLESMSVEERAEIADRLERRKP